MALSEEVDEELQFLLDDVQSTSCGTSVWAFQRAVCVPFQMAAPIQSHPNGALERQVRQILGGIATRTAAGAGAPDVHMLAEHLRLHGLHVIMKEPGRSLSHAPLTTKSISSPYLLVTRGDAAEQTVPTDEFSLVLVDPSLREHLAVAPATPAYRRALAAAVPEVFVGGRARLAELVTHMATHIAANFRDQGVALPPWRGRQALLNRWAAVDQHVQVQLPPAPAPSALAPGAQGVSALLQQQQPATPQAISAAVGSPVSCGAQELQAVPRGMQPGERTVHGGRLLAGRPEAAVHVVSVDLSSGMGARVGLQAGAPTVVVGFKVGGAAAPQECGRREAQGRDGGAAARASQGSSTCSTACEEVLGVSPLSVFRDR